MAVVCLLTALVGTFYVLRALKNQPAPTETDSVLGPAETIERLGGRITRADGGGLEVSFRAASNVNLQLVLQLENVVLLDLSNSGVTDRGLRQLADLSGLEVLKLDNTPVTDDGLKSLPPLRKLQHLGLAGTAVRGPGLAHLKDLADLKVLFLSRTAVDDPALSHLSGMARLMVLFLDGTPPDQRPPGAGAPEDGLITDAGLMQLSPLANLRVLDVRHTGVTPEGAAEFRKALPACQLRN